MDAPPTSEATLNRRPLRVREWRVMHWLAGRCAARGILPNQVSLFSMAGAGIAAIGIILLGWCAHPAALILSAVLGLLGILLRVLANLIDGMIAVEGGHRTPSGEVYNDVPDRVSDSIIFIALGYAGGTPGFEAMGWLAALLAMMTAYARLLGGACGLRQSFAGPMAKPHRMAVTTFTLLLMLAAKLGGGTGETALGLGLFILCAGSGFTAWHRIRRIVGDLECPPS